MSFPEPSSQDVLTALEKTGFLLEQETAKILKGAGFHTTTGRAYEDPDEGKSREIDCVGYRQFAHDREAKWHVSCRVAVECKNVKHPHVVIGRTPNPAERFRTPAEAWFTEPTIREPLKDRSGYIERSRWRGMPFDELPHNPYAREFVGDQLLRLQLNNKAWAADNSGVFDSVVFPLAKAVRALQSDNWRPAQPRKFGQDQFSMDLTYALLVTSSALFEVNADGADPTVQKVPWTSVSRDLKTSKLSGTFLVHIVTIDHLPEFLENCNEFMGLAADVIQSRPHLLSRPEIE